MKATPTAISAAASSEGSSGTSDRAQLVDEGAALEVAACSAAIIAKLIASASRKSAEDEHVEDRVGGGDPGAVDDLVEGDARRPAGRWRR